MQNKIFVLYCIVFMFYFNKISYFIEKYINFIYSADNQKMDFNMAEPTCYRFYFPYASPANKMELLRTYSTTPRFDSILELCRAFPIVHGC